MTIPTLVTVEQLRAHLRLGPATDGSPSSEDADLQMKIDAATQLVCEHIADRQPADTAWIATIESWNTGSPVVAPPAIIVAAVLVQTGELYRFRGDDLATDAPPKFSLGYLSPMVIALLQRYRSPSLA